MQSLVCWPPQNAKISLENNDSTIDIKGVAWSGGGSGIYRVDISIDGGKSWTKAQNLYKPVIQHRRSQFGWTQFLHRARISDEMKEKLRNGEPVKLEITSIQFI